jgi:hypothetical protein
MYRETKEVLPVAFEIVIPFVILPVNGLGHVTPFLLRSFAG